ncbi:MAG: DUF3857 domain-containing protein [Alphaproteobacteria bacterium]|nr:DUF3857 domain-containing protein [Alphaproteobacteria bacterium]
MKLRAACAALLLSLALVGAPPADAGRAHRLPRWVAQEPFSADMDALLKVAEGFEVEPGSPAKLLLSERRYDYDADGNARVVRRSVFQVLVPEPGGWGELSAGWDPWREEKPVLRARVRTPSGELRELDPSAVRELAASQMGASMYSDQRVLVAGLPGIEPGALVETEVITPTSRPMLEGMGMNRYSFGYVGIPVLYERLIVSAPAGVTPLLEQSDIAGPKRKSQGDRVSWTWGLAEQAPYGPRPVMAPFDYAEAPTVGWTLVPSWAEVAQAYDKIVQQQIGDADLAGIVAEATAGVEGRDAVIAALLARVHRDARYTGLELDEAAVVPRTPEEIFSRGYGDCKDKAALLVALLREAGIDAHVALLRAGEDLDVSPGLPGPNLFNHAIAVIPGAPDLWIDVTAEFHPAGVVPLMDQGRQALVASPDTTGLTQIPRASAEVNHAEGELRLDLRRPGFAAMEYTQTSVGEGAASSRGYRSSMDWQLWQDSVQRYAEGFLLAEGQVTSLNSEVDAVGEPYSLTVMLPASRRFKVGAERVELTLFDPAANTMASVLGSLAMEDLDLRSAPVHPLAQSQTFTLEAELPLGYEGLELPEGAREEHAGLRYERQLELLPPEGPDAGATLRITTAFSITSEPKTVDEVVAFGSALVDEMMHSDRWTLLLESDAERDLDEGRHGEALERLRALAEAHPEDATLAWRHARLLFALGFLKESQVELERALSLDPRLAEAHGLLVQLLLSDGMGNSRASSHDHARVVEAARRAWELDDQDASLERLLELVLENGYGTAFGPGADIAAALDILDEVEAQDEEGELSGRFIGYKALSLLREGRYDEVLDMELVPSVEILAQACEGRGVEAAELAQALPPEQRREELSRVRDLGLSMRCHAGLQDLDARVKGVELEDWMRELQRVEDLAPAEGFEELATRALLQATLSHSPPEGLELEAGPEGWEPLYKRAFISGAGAPVESNAWADLALSLGERHVVGDPALGQALVVKGEVDDWRWFFSVVLVQEGKDGWRFSDAGRLGLLRAAAAHLEAGDRENALALAALAADYTEEAEIDLEDPLEPNFLAWLARAGELSAPGRVEALVGAGLCVADVEADLREGLRLLDEAEAAGAPLPPLVRARLAAYRTLADPEGTAEAAADMLALLPEDEDSYWKVYLAAAAGDMDAAHAIIDASWPSETDPERWLQLARAASVAGQIDEAIAARAKAVELGDDDANHYNEMAWYSLFKDELPDELLEWGEGAVNEEGYNQAAAHTLAAVHLALGDPDAASVLLGEYLHKQGGMPAEAHWYYILGGLAEAWGLPDAARRAYAQVEPSPDRLSTYALTQLALERLDAEAP